ncbi:MAG: flagellar biosynthetic protein FliO [Candidatus Glassbacteria bacterium]|nr:flagellar biosynthetic protein FliO [Candidatus Glassbacteria bacterium]
MAFSIIRRQVNDIRAPEKRGLKICSRNREAAFSRTAAALSILLAAILFLSPAAGLCRPGSAPEPGAQGGTDAPAASGQSRAADTQKSLRDSSGTAAEALDSLAAARTAGPSFPQAQASPIDWVWVFAAIFIVIGLLLLFLYLLRMIIYRPPGVISGGGQFEILRQFHLGPRKSLCLVKVCDRIFLLGVTETSITRLMEVDDPEEAARLQVRLEASPKGQVRQFREVYHDLVGKFRK